MPEIAKKWFVLRVMSGKEKKVKEYLESEIARSGWTHIISQILIPTEKVYKLKAGKKITQERNFFPGYILVEAEEKHLTKDLVQQVNNMNGVVSFLSNRDRKPVPLKPSEVNRILGKVDEMQETGETMQEPFIVGETIKIIDGPFNDFHGVIEEVYDEKKKVKVMVKIFGRRTPVELNFVQVEKVQ